MLDSAGVFGVPLYTKIVVSGGDTWRRRNQFGIEPNAVDEISSLGVGVDTDVRSEDRMSRLDHGDRARTGREQPHHGLPTLVGLRDRVGLWATRFRV